MRHGDQTRGRAGAPQRVHPPDEIVVGVVAEHGHDHLPAPGPELAHGPREVRGRLDLGAAVRHPLADAVQQAAAAAAFGAHGENAQRLPLLLARRRGRSGRRSGRYHPGHALTRPPPA